MFKPRYRSILEDALEVAIHAGIRRFLKRSDDATVFALRGKEEELFAEIEADVWNAIDCAFVVTDYDGDE